MADSINTVMQVQVQHKMTAKSNDAGKKSLLTEWNNLTATKDKKIALGVAFFGLLFTKYPHYMKLFKQFEGMSTVEQVVKTDELKAHGLRFVNTMCGIFESLDDASMLNDMLTHVGTNHKKHNVTPEHFKSTVPVLEEALLGVLTKAESKSALQDFLKVAAPVIINGNK